MKLIKSIDLNKKKWNELVLKNKGSYFSFTHFLDAVAKNYAVLTDENYTKGFVIVYNEISKIKIIYPAIFGRTTEFFNMSNIEIQAELKKIKTEFKTGLIQSELNLNLENKTIKKYQQLENEIQLNSQAKRMIKKAEKIGITLKNCDSKEFIPILKSSLSGRINTMSSADWDKLNLLCEKLTFEGKIISLGIYNIEGDLCGGVIFSLTNDKIFYILGGALETEKLNGGIYLAMQQAIKTGLNSSKKIDFGGSNIDSIRQFYQNFGGTDVEYYSYSWGNSPFYFKILRKIYKKIKSKIFLKFHLYNFKCYF
jgi:hypothetical protein